MVLLSTLVGFATGGARAIPEKSPLPQEWVDPATGAIDMAKVPDRVKYSTELSASGYAWIDSQVLFGGPLQNGRITLYLDQSSPEVVGFVNPDTGRVTDMRGIQVGRSDSATQTTVVSFESTGG